MPEYYDVIDANGDTDTFSVFLSGGLRYYIELEGKLYAGNPGLRDPFLRLFQNGVSILSDNDGGIGLHSRLLFTPSVSGEFTVEASEYGNDATGWYRLRVFEDDFQNSWEGNGFVGALNPGAVVGGRINYGGDIDVFGANLIAGHQYFIEMRGASTSAGTLRDPLLSLQRTDGVPVAFDDDGGGGFDARIVFTPTVSDFYIVAAGRDQVFSSSADAGTFRLSVAEDEFRGTVEGVGAQGAVATGGSAGGTLSYGEDTDIFATTLISGLTYTIEQRGAATGDGSLVEPFLLLLDGDDATLKSDFGSGVGDNALMTYTAGFTGTHYLQAREWFGDGTGTYRVFVSEGLATAANDNIAGTGVADAINGAGGDDTLRGGTGNDTLLGGNGDDVLVVDAGADVLNGGNGRDTLLFTRAMVADWQAGVLDGDIAADSWTNWEVIQGSGGDDRVRTNSWGYSVDLRGGAGNDVLAAGVSGVVADILSGEDGNDQLDGGAGADTISGGTGNDTVRGGTGSDNLLGGAGADLLAGGDGNETLNGGGGTDTLQGGTGEDRFDFNMIGESPAGPSCDVLRAGEGGGAFDAAGAAAGDRIDLVGIDANLTAAGNQAFIFGGTGKGHVWCVNSGNTTQVLANIDNDAEAELQINILDGAVLASVYAAGDFSL